MLLDRKRLKQYVQAIVGIAYSGDWLAFIKEA